MRMTNWVVAGLVALNAVLGLAVYNRVFKDRPAYAQAGVRKDVMSVSGYVNGQSYIYLWDTIGGMMVVLKPDPVNKKVDVIARKDVLGDLNRVK